MVPSPARTDAIRADEARQGRDPAFRESVVGDGGAEGTPTLPPTPPAHAPAILDTVTRVETALVDCADQDAAD